MQSIPFVLRTWTRSTTIRDSNVYGHMETFCVFLTLHAFLFRWNCSMWRVPFILIVLWYAIFKILSGTRHLSHHSPPTVPSIGDQTDEDTPTVKWIEPLGQHIYRLNEEALDNAPRRNKVIIEFRSVPQYWSQHNRIPFQESWRQIKRDICSETKEVSVYIQNHVGKVFMECKRTSLLTLAVTTGPSVCTHTYERCPKSYR